jgi:acetylornithine deacetylase/succinyl-diaminopimelate desuccinylase-like protein
MARAFPDGPPVGLKVFVEGEEEVGSVNFGAYLDRFGELLAADVVVVPDSVNWAAGRPAITTSLRGLVGATVEVRVLDTGIHSGLAGGPIPDALTCLSRILATLHDDRGSVAVPGLTGFDSPPLDLTEEVMRATYPLRPGVELLGEGSITSRMWTRPAISVVALDAPRIDEAINQLVPAARAKVSLRIAPDQDLAAAVEALTDHLTAAAPWGAEVEVEVVEPAEGFLADTSDPRFRVFREAIAEAWGTEALEIGVGGTIPIMAEIQRVFPEAAIVMTAVMDPTSSAHGPDESVDLGDLEKAVLAEAVAMRLLAG